MKEWLEPGFSHNYLQHELIDTALDKFPEPIFRHFIERYEKVAPPHDFEMAAALLIIKHHGNVAKALEDAEAVRDSQAEPHDANHEIVAILNTYQGIQ